MAINVYIFTKGRSRERHKGKPKGVSNKLHFNFYPDVNQL